MRVPSEPLSRSLVAHALAGTLSEPPETLLSHIRCQDNLFRIRTSEKRACNTLRIRTYKTLDLKPFGIRTYRKTWGVVLPRLKNQMCFSKVPLSGAPESLFPRPHASTDDCRLSTVDFLSTLFATDTRGVRNNPFRVILIREMPEGVGVLSHSPAAQDPRVVSFRVHSRSQDRLRA